jgi:hypothetical protein
VGLFGAAAKLGTQTRQQFIPLLFPNPRKPLRTGVPMTKHHGNYCLEEVFETNLSPPDSSEIMKQGFAPGLYGSTNCKFYKPIPMKASISKAGVNTAWRTNGIGTRFRS